MVTYGRVHTNLVQVRHVFSHQNRAITNFLTQKHSRTQVRIFAHARTHYYFWIPLFLPPFLWDGTVPEKCLDVLCCGHIHQYRAYAQLVTGTTWVRLYSLYCVTDVRRGRCEILSVIVLVVKVAQQHSLRDLLLCDST